MECPIYFMVFLEVYYTSLDFGGIGAEGYTLTTDNIIMAEIIEKKEAKPYLRIYMMR